jgi:hypothetical protein
MKTQSKTLIAPSISSKGTVYAYSLANALGFSSVTQPVSAAFMYI